MGRKILIVDDEKEILELIQLYLEKEGHEVIKAGNGIEAWNKILENDVDLAVIDIMLPGLDGYQLTKKIREKYTIPIIILSAKNEDNDKILGLDLGADDYVTKPFNPLELLSRVQAQLRRVYKLSVLNEDNKENKIIIGDIILDEKKCTVFKNGKEVSLTYTEYKILSILMKNPGRVFTKKQIFEKVWEENYYGDDNIIMVHISNIRDKIEDDGIKETYLKTIRGLGYKFDKLS
ncbi:response regulator transcription factor [Clostridium tagluense]|uniref:response regulator transcription factor n=1 Tax=Clostridium tagluense TaxID=360422 RepID=UPI001C6EAD1E|nr:response regulator transcription factor [Clostridium tagluense]MBW9156948.1 response regulator transcription factor [Clostridium tagluense]WLC66418.1 response regulator transcription factor [Clostridium tagluense]